MNYVEAHTWSCIRGLMIHLDPERQGVAIDAGAGEGDYYFEWFANFGYQTVLVEPIPSDYVRQLAGQHQVHLYLYALSDHNGWANLYTSSEHYGIHSLSASTWGKVSECQQVGTISLITLIGEVVTYTRRITVLKLDIEGAEPVVIQQLDTLHPRLRPAIVSFEFGGIHPVSEGVGAWSSEHRASLLQSFATLKANGYRKALLITSGNSDRMDVLDLQQPLAFESIFRPDDIWGNIVTTRSRRITADQLIGFANDGMRFTP